MCVKNTKDKYGVMAKGFHWIIGLAMLCLLVVGIYMADLDKSPLKWELYDLHKATGIFVLALASLRVIWRFMNVQPESLPTHKIWEKALSKITHIVLYVTMLGMPLSGWVMSSAGEHPISFFGLFKVPPIVGKNEELGELAHEIHGILGYMLLVTIGLHLAGVAKHHFLDKDETLNRMFYKCFGNIGSLLVLALGGAVFATSAYFIALRLIFS